ncbi:MAG TPA: nucleoside monophosphate kinase, partial [Gemmataceae bacterium]
FPRTVPQAEALDDLLKKKHIKLDAVIELRVNESALLQRVESRVAEMRARGEEVRVDDTPEVLAKRLASYRSLTEPLIHYYSERRKLLTVDGMMTIEHVTREINRILAAIGAVETKGAHKKAAPKKATAVKRARKPAKTAAKSASKSTSKAGGKKQGAGATGKAAKATGRAQKPASKRAKKASRKGSVGSKARPGRRSAKVAKKLTKRRAKA